MIDLILKLKMLIENSQFNNGLSESNAAMRGLNKTALAVNVAIAGMFAGSVDATRDLLVLNKELNNLHSQLGASRESLQLWTQAGNDLDLDIADMFKDVNEKIAEFVTTGGGEAADVFKRIKLEAKDLAGLSPDKQLLLIAKAMSEVKDMGQGEKTFLLESLANDASKLLPLLDNNAAKLRELEKAMLKNGIFITPEQEAVLTRANNHLKELQLQAKGLQHQVGQIGAALVNEFSDDAAKALDYISSAITEVESSIHGFIAAYEYAMQGFTDSSTESADSFGSVFGFVFETAQDGFLNLPVYAQQAFLQSEAYGKMFGLAINETWYELDAGAGEAFASILDFAEPAFSGIAGLGGKSIGFLIAKLADLAGAAASAAGVMSKVFGSDLDIGILAVESNLRAMANEAQGLGDDVAKGFDGAAESIRANARESLKAAAQARLNASEIRVEADAAANAASEFMRLNEAKKHKTDFDAELGKQNAELEKQKSLLDDVSGGKKGLYTNEAAMNETLKNGNSELKNQSAAIKEFIASTKQEQDAIKQLTEEIEGQEIALSKGQIAAKYYADRLAGISAEISKMAAGNRQFLLFQQELNKLQEEGRSIGAGLADRYLQGLDSQGLKPIDFSALEEQSSLAVNRANEYKKTLDDAAKSAEKIGTALVSSTEKAGAASARIVAQIQKAANSHTKEISVINKVSAETGTDKTLMQTMAWIESRFNGQASNSAGYKGLYQFGHGTSKQYGVAGKELDIEANTRAYVELLKDNTAQLKKYGLQITGVNQYLAHQQGAYGLKEITKEAEGRGTMRADVRRNMLNNKPDNMQGDSAQAFLAAWGEKYATYEASVKALNSEQAKLTQETAKTGSAVQVSGEAIKSQGANVLYISNLTSRDGVERQRQALLAEYMGNQSQQAVVDAQKQAEAIGLSGYQLRANQLELDKFSGLQKQVILDAESNVDFLQEENAIRQQLAAIKDPWAGYKSELSQKRLTDAQQLALVTQKQALEGEKLVYTLQEEGKVLQMTDAQKYAHQLKTQGQSDAYVKLASSIRASNLAIAEHEKLQEELDALNLDPIQQYEKQLIKQGVNPQEAALLADEKRYLSSQKITKELDKQLELLGASNLEQLEYEYRAQGLNELQIQYNLEKAKALEIGKQELQVISDLRDGLEGAIQSALKGSGFDFGSIADGLQNSFKNKVFKASFDADFGSAKSIKDLLKGLQGHSVGNNIQQYAQQFGMGGIFKNAGQATNLQYGAYTAMGGMAGEAMFGSGGQIGGQIGAALGTAIAGPVGAAIGTVLGGFVGSVFGGKYEKTGGGVRLSYTGGGVYGNEYTDETKEGGLFKKDKKRRTFDGLDTALQDQLNAYFDTVESSLVAQADALSGIGVGVGKEAAQAVIDGFGGGVGAQVQAVQQVASQASMGISSALISKLLGGIKGLPDDVRKQAEASFKEIDLTGKSEAEQKKLIEDWAAGVQDQLYKGVFGADFDSLKALAVAGENTTQTFTRLIAEMQSVQSMVEMTGGVFDATGADIVKASDAIVKLFGSVESLNSAASFFYENYFTEEERKQKSLEKATKDTAKYNDQLAALGYGSVKSRQDLRNLLAGLDETSESGQKAYLIAMQLAQSFDVLADAQEAAEQAALDAIAALEEEAKAKAEANARLAESLNADIKTAYASLRGSDSDTRINILKERISEEQSYYDDLNSAIQDRYKEELDALRELQKAAESIGGYIDSLSLSDLSTLNPMDKLAEAQKQYLSTLDQAKSGDAKAADNLPDAAKQYLTIAREVYASGDDYTAIFENVNGGLSAVEEAINKLPEPAKPAEIASLLIPRLERQIEAIEAQTEYLKKQEIAKDISAKLEELSLATGQDIRELAANLGISLAELAKYGATPTPTPTATGTGTKATTTGTKTAGAPVARDATDQRILDYLKSAKMNTASISKGQAEYVAGVLSLKTNDVYDRVKAMNSAPAASAKVKTYTKEESAKFNKALIQAQALNEKLTGGKRLPQNLSSIKFDVFAKPAKDNGIDMQSFADYLRDYLKYTGTIVSPTNSYSSGIDTVIGNQSAYIHDNEMILNKRQAGSVRDNLVLAMQGMAKIGSSKGGSGLNDNLLIAIIKELSNINKAILLLANDGNSNADAIADLINNGNGKLQSILNAQLKPAMLKGAAA